MSNSLKIAFFDFDGTITRSDTMLEIVKFHFGKTKFYSGLILVSPWLLGMKSGLMSHQRTKEKFLKYFWGGMNHEEFEKICQSFSSEKLPDLVRDEAVKKIEELKSDGTEIVVVTASPSAWIKYWCEKQEITFISSELEIADGKITGRLSGLNCIGPEKVKRIRHDYDLRQYSVIYCYGDSLGDKEMMALATEAHYKEFN